MSPGIATIGDGVVTGSTNLELVFSIIAEYDDSPRATQDIRAEAPGALLRSVARSVFFRCLPRLGFQLTVFAAAQVRGHDSVRHAGRYAKQLDHVR